MTDLRLPDLVIGVVTLQVTIEKGRLDPSNRVRLGKETSVEEILERDNRTRVGRKSRERIRVVGAQ